ncbi:rab11 family-interacting 4 isoform X2 [Brachionus plicatilis]|uniref:Rab11 family-interacting 4 isoform X2 n=1 Tax=Brachionus plicatilis TaxID=10195 RepID=A0A3M7QL68_BRAPC|nr:rab11 family-interacting 4 isoform X2 [Brachionus plicatilis]
MNFVETEIKASDDAESNENKFQNLFKLYDPNGTGNIKTDDFIKKTQDLIKDLNLEQIDLNGLVNDLDPFGLGILSYNQLKDAIGKFTGINESNEMAKEDDLMDDFSDIQGTNLEKDSSLVSSPFSNNTYAEYDFGFESSLNMPKNDLDNDFFSLDMTNNQDGNNIPTSISNSNFYEQSLSKKKMLRERSFQSLPHRQQIPDIIDDNPRLSIAITDDAIENYEKHLKTSEDKVKELTQQVNNLSSENKELCNQIDKIKSDYELIEIKYTDFEKVIESNHVLEQTIYQLKAENTKLKEELRNTNSSWNDERDIFSKKTENFEQQLNAYRIENQTISEELKELLDKNEKFEEDFQKLTDCYRKILNENQRLESEKEFIADEMSNQLNDYCQKIDSLEQNLEIAKAENENLKSTLTSAIINEAIQPVQTLQDERLSSHNINVESVNTKINHLFDDEPNISSTYGVTSGSSLAAEMENSSIDNLLAKLNEEKQANLRLREYMDNIMLKLWTENPELFLSCVGVKNK